MNFVVISDDDICRLQPDEVLFPCLCSAQAESLPRLSSIPLPAQQVATITTSEAFAQEKIVNNVDNCVPCISLDTLVLPNTEQNVDLGQFFNSAMKHGHFYVDVDCDTYGKLERGHLIAEDIFGLQRDEKAKLPLDAVLRIWGWKALDFKRKECFKFRDRGDCLLRERWPASFPPAVDVKSVFDTFYHVAHQIASSLLSTVYGVSSEHMDNFLHPGPSQKDAKNDYAASFLELFRYDTFNDLSPGLAAVPCEAHGDVGMLTISMCSKSDKFSSSDDKEQQWSESGGLQVYDWSANQWVDAEAPMRNKNRLIVLFGEHLQWMTRGEFHHTPHRVVLSPQSRQSRISQIFEILPHPESQVPVVARKSGEEIRSQLSKDIFIQNSTGISSVNFE